MKITLLFMLFVLPVIAADAQEKAGFFLMDAQPKTAELPDNFTEEQKPTEPANVTVKVDAGDVVAPVSPYVFGNNANIFMTQMIDQPVLIDRIRALAPRVLRFPGGNLSSVYFWNADAGVPPADAPSELMDANGQPVDPGYWYGRNTESWTMSVDNYYRMLEATQTTGIITVNYGYARYGTASDPVAAAAHLAAEWVRYDNGRTKFWEIGNESNGSWQAGYRIKSADNHDGQPEIVTGALYGRHFKVFADSMRNAAAGKGVAIYIGAQLLAEPSASWWNDTDRHWNEGVFENAGDSPDFYIIHSYYTPYQQNSGASEILGSATQVTRNMMEYVTTSSSDAGVSPKPVALTEWNIFAEGSRQQVSFISGMHAAIVLGELVQAGYGLACRWDLANGWNNGNDHGMFSQGGEPGVPKWNPRPVYYYMYYFRKCFGDKMVRAQVIGSEDVLAYASTFSSGEAGIVVVNTGKDSKIARVDLTNFGYGERFYYYTLTGGADNGDFSGKVYVNGEGSSYASGGPEPGEVVAKAGIIGGGVRIALPGRSVQYIVVEHGNNLITARSTDAEQVVAVYPNPAGERLRVSWSFPGFRRLEITDLQGKRICESAVDPRKSYVDLKAAMPSGVYVVHLNDGRTIVHRRIIIY